MQQKLLFLYRTFFKSALSPTRCHYACQETLGWNWKKGEYYPWPHPPLTTLGDFLQYDHGVDALVSGYSEFDFSRHRPSNLNGPFWRAFHFLLKPVKDNDGAMLWTNVFRCNVDGSVLNHCSPGLQEIARAVTA